MKAWCITEALRGRPLVSIRSAPFARGIDKRGGGKGQGRITSPQVPDMDCAGELRVASARGGYDLAIEMPFRPVGDAHICD
jgi:hypothetical protein